MVTPSACRFPWCIVDHSIPEWAHSHRSEPVEIGLAAVDVLLVDTIGDAGMVEVRLPGMTLEFSPWTAADVAELLERIDPGTAVVVAGALRTGAVHLGVDAAQQPRTRTDGRSQ